MTKLLLPPSAVAAEHSDDNARRLAEILHAYDPRISLEYIPEADATERSLTAILKPFRVVKVTPEVGHEILRYLSHEDMKKPADILTWLWEGDFAKHRPNDIINRIEMKERAERMLNLKAEQDAAQDRQDKVAWGARGGRDGKHYLRFNKRVKITR